MALSSLCLHFVSRPCEEHIENLYRKRIFHKLSSFKAKITMRSNARTYSDGDWEPTHVSG